MKEVLRFLSQLARNNNRNWFEQHKDEYRAVQAYMDGFTTKLIAGIGEFDPTVRGLTVKDCTYRIYRDVRFSPNKEPYKTHFGAFIAQGGKKSGFGGYYFHIEVPESYYLGESLLASGVYCPQPADLKAIRLGIVDHSDEFLSTLKSADGFELMSDESTLKRVPKGFPADSPVAEYLKFKNLSLDKLLSPKIVTSPDLLDYSLTEYRKTLPFIRFINSQIEQYRSATVS